jgi:hypothetical protein
MRESQERSELIWNPEVPVQLAHQIDAYSSLAAGNLQGLRTAIRID